MEEVVHEVTDNTQAVRITRSIAESSEFSGVQTVKSFALFGSEFRTSIVEPFVRFSCNFITMSIVSKRERAMPNKIWEKIP